MASVDPKHELVSTIREVFGYIARFKKQLFILKLEDTLLNHPLFPVLMRDIAQLHKIGIRILIVPGCRQSIDMKLEHYQIENHRESGIRITSREAMPFVEMAALGVTETILSHLTANGCHGVQGNWVQARAMGIHHGIDYQATGAVEKIQSSILDHLMDDLFIPILPPIGWNKLGHPYNINSTELAKALCQNLQVGKLFFIGMEEGIVAKNLIRGNLNQLLEINEWGIVSALDVRQAKELLQLNPELPHTQREYLQNAVEACEAGANRVHLINGLSQGSVLHEVFSSRGDGTMVYSNQYSLVREAHADDVPEILRIMEDYIHKGFLVSRTQEQILQRLTDYLVYEVDNTILGCGALHDWGEKSCEVAGIAVDPNYRKSGVGEVIVKSLLQRAVENGFSKVFLLTTRASDWFYTLGFKDGKIEDLPRSKRDVYNLQRNSRVLIREPE